jgi:hypothetical protein
MNGQVISSATLRKCADEEQLLRRYTGVGFRLKG